MQYKNGLAIIAFLLSSLLFGQQNKYRASKEKKHSLVHTKLKVSFNFSDKTMNGEAWITAKPYYFSQSEIILDAKEMKIYNVMLNNKKLDFNYDRQKLKIALPKTYQKGEEFTIYINYLAQPEKVNQSGSAAISQAKGLYFINPTGLDKNKSTQIWTQGETEASSCWFPTLDAPNQKTSQEIYITVPKKYVTLSNGKLVSQTEKGNKRTDYWKFDQRHAPYLFFMGVGEFEIIKDSYKNIPVNYYVEKEFAPYAKQIFGDTPEMIGFFADKLGVEFPWNKYSQIVGRDFVSGAMENTTAVIHGEKAYQKPGQLIDENKQINTIAHEVFHHWFGNLVTTESWSNLALNEAFANYAEYLWREHKYGKENAEIHKQKQIAAYKNGKNYDKPLVRFQYEDKEDMFDEVSYNKGGVILHMLRNYLGDKAFFEGLKEYLTRYKYKSAEVHQLRLVFEELTGKDLNWFFNQWFYGIGHPKLQISYDYNPLRKNVAVNVLQLQSQPFRFPLTVDVFEGGKASRYQVFIDSQEDSFVLPFTKLPDLIQINADGVLLCDIIENKVLSDYIFQLKNAKNFTHKREALLEVAKKQADKKAFKAVVDVLDGNNYELQILALNVIDLSDKNSKKRVIDKIVYLAENSPKTLVRAAAIKTLGKLTDVDFKPLFSKALNSKSYAVLGSALVAMYYVDSRISIEKSKSLPDEVRKILATPLTQIFVAADDTKEYEFIAKNVITGLYLSKDSTTKSLYQSAYNKIIRSNKPRAIQNLTDDIVAKGKQYKSFGFDVVGVNLLRQIAQIQKNSSNSKKQQIITIVKTGIAKLLI